MTRNQIVDHVVRTGPNDFELNVPCKFFASDIKVIIFAGDSDANNVVISDYLVDCINDIIGCGDEEKPGILRDIYNDYENAIRVTDYGMVPGALVRKHNGNTESANREYFNINSEEEAFFALEFNYAMVVEYARDGAETIRPRYFGFFFERPWNSEHELQLEFENGKYKKLL